MKRLLAFFVALVTIVELQAQDLILLKSAEEINGKVEQISRSELSYRKAELPEGPLYTIPLKDVFSVTYANGVVETFKTVPESSGDVSYDDYPYPNVSKAYKVGDFFDEDGVRGVVIHTTDNGRHGLILSCVESNTKLSWGFTKKGERVEVFVTGARNRDDGWENMKVIADIIGKTDLRWTDFPAFNFCRDLGHGWYLPAINEIMMIFNLASQRPVKSSHFRPYQEVDEYLERYASYGVDDIWDGGFDSYHLYGSSTEVNCYEIYYMTCEKEIKLLDDLYYGRKARRGFDGKYLDERYVRAVHKF